jgi:predicted membrane chloride channel (bestrophin family)
MKKTIIYSLQWIMIPVVSLICWSLIVIEELGHVIEDPFNVHVYLPSIGTIQRNSIKDRA